MRRDARKVLSQGTDLAFGGRVAADPRIRPHEHYSHQRLRQAARGKLSGQPIDRARRGRYPIARSRDAIAWRHSRFGVGVGDARADHRIRTRRGRGGRGEAGQEPRTRTGDKSGHGRHDRQGGDHRGFRTPSQRRVRGRVSHELGLAAQPGRRLSAAPPHPRSGRDRRGRGAASFASTSGEACTSGRRARGPIRVRRVTAGAARTPR